MIENGPNVVLWIKAGSFANGKTYCHTTSSRKVSMAVST
ncbi:hypothetical protein EDD27_7663 [Nonomuraea polychroma]|uniref:Uncharacterized protein n=1 Tax=Nonomuraea polychroma TaxID=46176 RepID=A0A438MGL2_9ACTN|nr:hypothetical protein EDD27_7663 [Nonomuraea polychroma]